MAKQADTLGDLSTMHVETERLIIDDVRAADKQDYFDNISHDKKVLETFICRYADDVDAWDFDAYLDRPDLFAIRLRDTGRLIGVMTFFDERAGACEVGYGLGSRYWGKGYATEATKAFIDYLFDARPLSVIYASHFVGNDASRRVMEKCGMTYDHYVPHELQYLGVDRDLVYYAIGRGGQIATKSEENP